MVTVDWTAKIMKLEAQYKSGKVKASMEMFLKEEKERFDKFIQGLNEEEKESQEVIKDVEDE